VRLRMAYIVGAAALALACSPGPRAANATQAAAVPIGLATPPAIAEDSPDSALARFLTFVIPTGRHSYPAALDSVYENGACRYLESNSETRWLADYRILATVVGGKDTAVVTAFLTSAATVRDDDKSIRGILEIRQDTANFLMVRHSGRWKACGDAFGGFGLILYGRINSWTPAGGSAAKAMAAIDSIRRARGLRLIR
jgi:hypothetical protein